MIDLGHLGCGDANILRTAATFFGIKGIGLEIEDVVLTEANVQIKADNLQHLVSVRIPRISSSPKFSIAAFTTLSSPRNLSEQNFNAAPFIFKATITISSSS